MLPYVYPYKSNDINGNEAWREMYLEFFTDVIFWLQEYYMRVILAARILHASSL